jgi:hypothetical protein
MPALAAGIHASLAAYGQDVRGRDKPGHDELETASVPIIGEFAQLFLRISLDELTTA